MTAEASPLWEDAALAAALFAIDPAGLGGVVVRAGPGDARDRWTAMVRERLPGDAPVRRVPLNIEDDRLLGGLDLPASLAAGRPVAQSGILSQSDGGVVILAMAERMEPAAAARIATALDSGEIAIERDGLALRLAARIGVIAFDEGLTPDERPPQALLDRLAFHLDLTLASHREGPGPQADAAEIAEARAGLAKIAAPDYAIIETLCAAALSVGVTCVRAPLLTLRAARAHAALQGRDVITGEDAAAAARLVLGPRARNRPSDPQSQQPEQPEPPEANPDPADPPPDQTDQDPSETVPDPTMDMVTAALKAALPDDLLDRVRLAERTRALARSRGSGVVAKSAGRGRPVGSRPGPLRSGARLNLVETLRAAAPWQRLRGGGRKYCRFRH